MNFLLLLLLKGPTPLLSQVTKENTMATAGVLGGVTGLLLGGFWAKSLRSEVKCIRSSWGLIKKAVLHNFDGLKLFDLGVLVDSRL